MIETVINLRDHEVWPKRKLRFDDAVAQTRVVLDALEAKGLLRRPASAEEREAPGQRGGDDRREPRSTRRSATWRCGGSRSSAPSSAAPWSARRSTPCSPASSPPPSPASRPPAEREALIEPLAKTYGDRLAVQVLPDDVTGLVNDAARRLIDAGRPPRPPRPAHAAPGPAGAGRRGRRRRPRLRQADPLHPDRRAPRRRPRRGGSRSG